MIQFKAQFSLHVICSACLNYHLSWCDNSHVMLVREFMHNFTFDLNVE